MFFKRFLQEIDAAMARDPAAKSRLEVALCYPGLQAVLFYRLSHALWSGGWRLLARLLSQFARFLTGIEIHPGARIGERLFIDHGMGVVIGETAEIGDDVTLYQGVTLGGTSPAIDSRAQAEKKRHPTLEAGVIVGSGAQVLGPIRVGAGARVGANAVVVNEVPAGVAVVGIPAKIVVPKGTQSAEGFLPYGTPTGDVSDPVARALTAMSEELALLRDRVQELEQDRRHAATGDEAPARVRSASET
jgi:serine O-acetyltransferase